MVVIGFMHYRKKPTGVYKAYAFAAVAQAEGAELLFFSPGAVDFENKKINGYIYKDGEWINIISNFPNVICNVESFSHNEEQSNIVSKLRKIIPFTTGKIDNKMWVYENLKKHKKFAKYIIPSEDFVSAKQFFLVLDKYKSIIFKPTNGRQGKGIYHIKKLGNKYEVIINNEAKNYSYSEMINFLKENSSEPYMIQPYIDCRTKAGEPYSLRLHVQKNKRGEWVVTQIYPSIGSGGNVVCNIWRGAYTMGIIPFLENEFETRYDEMIQRLEEFSLQLASHIDEIRDKYDKKELDELGIDIGLDSNREIWIFEINSRPGCPPAFNLELDVVKNAIHYSMFLAGKNNI